MQTARLTDEQFTSRSLWRLVLPLLADQVLSVTIGMADVMMVASLGEAQVSSVSVVDAINNLLLQVFAALTTGGAVVASQYMGRGDRDNACLSAKQLYLSVMAIGLAVMGVSVIFRAGILGAVYGRLDPDVFQGAKVYFLLTALSYPFIGLFGIGAAMFRSMRDSKAPMLISALMNIINIAGNAFTIFYLRWGVAGAGAATLLSRIAGAAIMLRMLNNPSRPIMIRGLLRFNFDWQKIRVILRVGVPSALENGIFNVGKLLVASLITSFGTYAIAANAVSGSLSGFAVLPGSAISMAMITVVGQCMGACGIRQAERNIKKLMTYAYAMVGVTSLAIFCMAPWLLSQYSNLSPQAAAISLRLLRAYALVTAVLWPMAFTFPNALRAAGDTRFTMFVSVASMWVFRIGLSYLLAIYFGLGVPGVWYAMYTDWLVRSVAFVLRYARGKWKLIKVI
jgi:putative MATE family efflux protein